MPNPERLAHLFQRYLDHMETPDELDELMQLIADDENKQVMEQLLDEAREKRAHAAQLNGEQTERLFLSVKNHIRPMRKLLTWWRMPTAAAVLMGLILGAYVLFFKSNSEPAAALTTVQPAAQDVQAPTGTKATITLADGRTVAIDSLSALTQGNVRLMKTATGELVYTGNAAAVSYNTLTNPRGSQVIDITLADGSRVWLNAGSSITYPVAFVGNERKVNITGEAYFEVSHDKTKPFYVSNGDMQVQVLGTHFNVNVYDEMDRVTLLEGSVRVSAIGSRQSAMLKPGEQVSVSQTSQLSQPIPVQTDEVIAWKNGLFQFNETDIQSIMAQIERWYDVQVVFEGNISQHFNGTIGRQVNVSKVLNMLEKTGGLHCSIQGKKVIVKQ